MRHPTPPIVSVILPVRDGERYLDEAVRSVLGQELAELELVIVDDGSTDSTPRIAASYPAARYLRLEPCGVSAARNAGVQASRGEYLAFLDADDVWHPAKLRSQVDILRRHAEIGYVTCQAELFLQKGCERPASLKPELFSSPQPALIPSALCVRRSVFERVGPFDPRLALSEDTDWFLRAKDAGFIHHLLPEVLVRKRVHPGSVSLRGTPGPSPLLSVLRDSIHRRRDGRA